MTRQGLAVRRASFIICFTMTRWVVETEAVWTIGLGRDMKSGQHADCL